MRLDPTQVLVALIALAGVAYTVWSNQRTAKRTSVSVERKVDVEAYNRGREADARTIKALQDEIGRLRAARLEDQRNSRRELDGARDELDRLQREVERLRDDLSTEQRTNEKLKDHIDDLERTIVRLRTRLAQAGLLDERRPEDSPDSPR